MGSYRRKTDAEKAWLRENYAAMPLSELVDRFEERFGWRPSASGIQSWAHDVGVSRKPLRYTEEEDDFLREFIPGHSEREISATFEARFGRPLSVNAISNRKAKLGVKSGTVGGRFEKGHTSANKGLTWDEMGFTEEQRERMRHGQFKKGNLPHNTRPLLAMRTGKGGYLEIHVGLRKRKKLNDQWMPYSHFVWEQANGREWPEGHRAIFADNDNTNYDPANIVPVPNELYPIVMGAVSNGVSYHDRETLEVAITSARVTQARERLRRRGRK